MKIAVIKTGGKQYVVREDEPVKVEKIPAEEGEKVTFNEVLLVAADKTAKIGTPTVRGAKVEGEVVKQGHHKKVTGVKMKAKKRKKKYFGHTQRYTEIEIKKITTK